MQREHTRRGFSIYVFFLLARVSSVLTFRFVYTSHQKVVLEIDFSGSLWVCRFLIIHSTGGAHKDNSRTGLHRNHAYSNQPHPEDHSSSLKTMQYVLLLHSFIISRLTRSPQRSIQFPSRLTKRISFTMIHSLISISQILKTVTPIQSSNGKYTLR